MKKVSDIRKKNITFWQFCQGSNFLSQIDMCKCLLMIAVLHISTSKVYANKCIEEIKDMVNYRFDEYRDDMRMDAEKSKKEDKSYIFDDIRFDYRFDSIRNTVEVTPFLPSKTYLGKEVNEVKKILFYTLGADITVAGKVEYHLDEKCNYADENLRIDTCILDEDIENVNFADIRNASDLAMMTKIFKNPCSPTFSSWSKYGFDEKNLRLYDENNNPIKTVAYTTHGDLVLKPIYKDGVTPSKIKIGYKGDDRPEIWSGKPVKCKDEIPEYNAYLRATPEGASCSIEAFVAGGRKISLTNGLFSEHKIEVISKIKSFKVIKKQKDIKVIEDGDEIKLGDTLKNETENSDDDSDIIEVNQNIYGAIDCNSDYSSCKATNLGGFVSFKLSVLYANESTASAICNLNGTGNEVNEKVLAKGCSINKPDGDDIVTMYYTSNREKELTIKDISKYEGDIVAVHYVKGKIEIGSQTCVRKALGGDENKEGTKKNDENYIVETSSDDNICKILVKKNGENFEDFEVTVKDSVNMSCSGKECKKEKASNDAGVEWSIAYKDSEGKEFKKNAECILVGESESEDDEDELDPSYQKRYTPAPLRDITPPQTQPMGGVPILLSL
ncbi:hypothetical protein [Halobacteriovorax sp. ZH2_bin.1]|uniref:hypothetical protein n=1 Tax=unclassified Halobacteriovorax TaxID=2639665 RepID=UPI003718F0D0